MGLEIRFYKRTKGGKTAGYIIRTSFDDTEEAIEFAEKLFKRTVKTSGWKVDKGFIKKQLEENET